MWKIVQDYDGDTYRAVCTAAFPEVVYVLDAFVKQIEIGNQDAAGRQGPRARSV